MKKLMVGALAVFGAGLSLFFTYELIRDVMGGVWVAVIAFAVFLQAAQYVYTIPNIMQDRQYVLRGVVVSLYLLSVAASYLYIDRSVQTQLGRAAHVQQQRAQAVQQHAQQAASLTQQVDDARQALDDERNRQKLARQGALRMITEGYATKGNEALKSGDFTAQVDAARATLQRATHRRDSHALTVQAPQQEAPLSLFGKAPKLLRVLVIGLLASVLEVVTFFSIRATGVTYVTHTPRKKSIRHPKVIAQPLPAPAALPTLAIARANIIKGVYTQRPVQGRVAEQEGLTPQEVAQLFRDLTNEAVIRKNPTSKRYEVCEA